MRVQTVSVLVAKHSAGENDAKTLFGLLLFVFF